MGRSSLKQLEIEINCLDRYILKLCFNTNYSEFLDLKVQFILDKLHKKKKLILEYNDLLDKVNTLDDKEKSVYNLIEKKVPWSNIAKKLGLSDRTIFRIWKKIKEKLGIE